MYKCAIVYHYLASYRKPIFDQLMKSNEVEYSIYSGSESEINIKKIDRKFSNLDISKGGLRWYILTNRWIFKKKFLWQKGILKIAMYGNYDSFIFLGSPYHISTWFSVIIARLRGKKTYYWMHGFYKDVPSKLDFLKLKLFYKLPNGFFLYGNRSKLILNKHKVKKNNQMNVIYNSLDYQKSIKKRHFLNESQIFDYRKKYFNMQTVPVVVFIGRLNIVKRIDMLIEAQNILKSKNNKNIFNLLIIGDGEEKKNLMHLSKKYGLENNINFFGEIYEEETIANLLMFADLCVTPGEVGLTAIHSLSYGTPVISHDNLNLQMPEVESINKGVNGDLYQYNNLEDLANVIANWLLIRPVKNQFIVEDCYTIIDKYYNPTYQAKVFEHVLLKNKKK